MSEDTPSNPYMDACDRFCARIGAFSRTTPMLIDVCGMVMRQHQAQLELFIKNHAVPIKNDEVEGANEDDSKSYNIDPTHSALHGRIQQILDDCFVSLTQLPCTTLVGMVSEFDVLLGRLIAAALRDKPAIIDASKRQITFADLARYPDIESARTAVIESEVEAVLRDNLEGQFTWLENRLGIPFRKGLNSWPQLVEITQRRNLLVHTDGHVSTQYLDNCRQHGAPIPNGIKVGDRLSVDPSYFRQARDTLLEVGIKLSQVLWRKMRSAEVSDAEDHLVDLGYDLVYRSLNNCAVAVLSFFVEDLKTWLNPHFKLTCTINLAQALKWSKKNDRTQQILKNLDEPVLSNRFRLAINVLKENFDVASSIMKDIGSNGEIRKEDYRDWPLFREFRKSAQFQVTFNELFAQPYDEFVQITKKVNDSIREEAKRFLEDEDVKSSVQTTSITAKASAPSNDGNSSGENNQQLIGGSQ